MIQAVLLLAVCKIDIIVETGYNKDMKIRRLKYGEKMWWIASIAILFCFHLCDH